MIITPTGYGPITIEPVDLHLTSLQKIGNDKRQVRVELIISSRTAWIAMHYLTQWESEHNFCWMSEETYWCEATGRFDPNRSVMLVASWARKQAAHMLPPGAGYPATPAFETRQARLRGLLETATLVGLSDVLTQWEERT